MHWFNAQIDKLPDDEQTVMVSVKGVYYIAIFDKHGNRFILKEQPEISYGVEDYLIYWTRFEEPGPD